ncbi:hypothetical protein [Bacteroides xylanisolvens]
MSIIELAIMIFRLAIMKNRLAIIKTDDKAVKESPSPSVPDEQGEVKGKL